jgi:hypothetical protein
MRRILAAALHHLTAALITVGSASCAHLIASAQPGQQPATTGGALTPDEEKAWADLVAQLVPDA